MITDIIQVAGVPEPITRRAPITRPRASHTRQSGIKAGCPLLPTLFLLYYDVLPRQNMSRKLAAQLYVFVDDIAVRAASQAALLDTLNHLHHVTYLMGVRFCGDKTETYHSARNYKSTTIIWQGQQLLIQPPTFGLASHTRRRSVQKIQPPILTYLGHILAHPCHKDHTCRMVTNQRRHNLAAHKTLPMNGSEKGAIMNTVLIRC